MIMSSFILILHKLSLENVQNPVIRALVIGNNTVYGLEYINNLKLEKNYFMIMILILSRVSNFIMRFLAFSFYLIFINKSFNYSVHHDNHKTVTMNTSKL